MLRDALRYVAAEALERHEHALGTRLTRLQPVRVGDVHVEEAAVAHEVALEPRFEVDALLHHAAQGALGHGGRARGRCPAAPRAAARRPRARLRRRARAPLRPTTDLAVAHRRVGLALVAQHHALALARELRVQARDARIEQHDVAVGLAPEPHRLALKREARALQPPGPCNTTMCPHTPSGVRSCVFSTSSTRTISVRSSRSARDGRLRVQAHLENDPAHADAVAGRDAAPLHGLAVQERGVRGGRQVLQQPAVAARAGAGPGAQTPSGRAGARARRARSSPRRGRSRPRRAGC